MQILNRLPRSLVCASAMLLGLLGCVALCYGGFYVLNQPKNGIHVEEVKTDAAKRIPLGSSKEEVEEWLASWQIEPTGIANADSGKWGGYGGTIPNDSYWQSPRRDSH